MIAFIQPAGLQGPAGLPKLLRGLLQGEHPPVLSINTSMGGAPKSSLAREIHLLRRPSFGRIERTRYLSQILKLEGVYRPLFEARLRNIFKKNHVQLIHLIPHTYAIVTVYKLSREMGIPLFLNVQDDIEYNAYGHPLLGEINEALGEAWRNAAGIFSISDALGKEYSRRYGVREYSIVTDGLKTIADGPRNRPQRSLRLYFMGLFHQGYGENLRAALDALKILRGRHPDWDISFTSRSESVACEVRADDVPVRIYGFAPSESVVETDMQEADFLYQPLPLYGRALSLSRFSMSTKMVSYLGSGLPIFYHGPVDAAAGQLLQEHGAATICATLDAEAVAEKFEEAMQERASTVERALKLARSQFMLVDQYERFWSRINAAI
jgi:hypothetical protein